MTDLAAIDEDLLPDADKARSIGASDKRFDMAWVCRLNADALRSNYARLDLGDGTRRFVAGLEDGEGNLAFGWDRECAVYRHAFAPAIGASGHTVHHDGAPGGIGRGVQRLIDAAHRAYKTLKPLKANTPGLQIVSEPWPSRVVRNTVGVKDYDVSLMPDGASLTFINENAGDCTVFAGGLEILGNSSTNEIRFGAGAAVRVTRSGNALLVEPLTGSPVYSSEAEPVRDFSVITGGQSHRVLYASEGGAGGLAAGLRENGWLGSAVTDSLYVIDGATGSSAIDKRSDAGNYWYDFTGAADGPALTGFIAALSAASGQPVPSAVLWTQFTSDAPALATGALTEAQYKATLAAVFDRIQAALAAAGASADVPILIALAPSRDDRSQEDRAVTALRKAVLELIAARMDCHLSCELYDLPRGWGEVHLSGHGYYEAGRREARVLDNVLNAAGNNLGPALQSAALENNGRSVRLSFAAGAGANLRMAAGFGGFGILPGGAAMAAPIAARDVVVEGGEIVITAAADLTGAKVIFPYGWFSGARTDLFPRDTDGLPLRHFITEALGAS